MKDLFLTNDTAKELYEEVKDLPIYDYHCHLSIKEIFEDKPVKNLTQLWLYGDHYKWRQMRTFGIDERCITGDASDYEKFFAYITMLETAVGNPLYLWSKFELEKYFGVTLDLTTENAEEIWKQANAAIESTAFSPKKAIAVSNVDTVVTTEEIFYDLNYHKLVKGSMKTAVLPAFRGDKAINVCDKKFPEYIAKLVAVTNISITDLSCLEKALRLQLDRFAAAGCVTSDFALDGFNYKKGTREEVNEVLVNALSGKAVYDPDVYMTHVTEFMLTECYLRGFSCQLHIGAMRNNNSEQYRTLGPDTGYDSISKKPYLTGIKSLLDSINESGHLGKTIIFNLNPADNEAIATLIGCYQGGAKGKMQFGAAWWFNDTKLGMQKHLGALSELTHLGCFIGMLTDSRSFISYTRHDYFRRILCDFIGKLVESGEFTSKEKAKKVAADVSFYNAKRYFEEK